MVTQSETEAYIPQFKASLKWSNCLRKHFPTLIFYFAQTYDQTIVLYYVCEEGQIQSAYTKLSIETLQDACPLPSMLEKYFTLLPGDGRDLHLLPCLEGQTPWTLSVDGKLTRGDHVLVSTMGIVEPITHQMQCVYCITINRQKREIEWSRESCTEEAKRCILDVKQGLWETLRNSINV